MLEATKRDDSPKLKTRKGDGGKYNKKKKKEKKKKRRRKKV